MGQPFEQYLVAPGMGLADGIVDLVSSGSTLIMNGLRSLGPLLASQAILVGHRDPAPATAAQAAELRTMIEAVIAGRGVKYLMMNAPRTALPAIEAILPGLESPGVLPLAHEGMVAVHAVVWAGDVHRIACPCARPARPASSSSPWRSCCHDAHAPRDPATGAPVRPQRHPEARPHRACLHGHTGDPGASPRHRGSGARWR